MIKGKRIKLEKVFNFDLTRQVDSMTVAYGAEWREETFEVISGEEASWKAGKYALQGFNVGSHGFAGFSPDSQGAFTRRSYGLYVDLENDGDYEIIFGTGGETISGNLWIASFSDLLNYIVL